jgi:glycosyltransferase involved in cell wall biosynthesis
MVGTIEPRKGILQAIAAFEQLWAKGIEVQLLLVGKQGWVGLQPEQRRSLPQIMKTLEHHPEIGKRLLWFPDISDQYLQKIYRTVACLLMVSEAEGFGLPLIEAAANNCPVIARDLPVFREVAGDYAQYFSGTQAQNLSNVIERWLTKQAHEGQSPLPTMNYSTWQENVAQTWQLLQIDP